MQDITSLEGKLFNNQNQQMNLNLIDMDDENLDELASLNRTMGRTLKKTYNLLIENQVKYIDKEMYYLKEEVHIRPSWRKYVLESQKLDNEDVISDSEEAQPNAL